MSKASCCCGLNASAATGPDATTTIATDAARRANQKRFRDFRVLRRISRTISLSQPCRPPRRIQTGNRFAGKVSGNAVAEDQLSYLVSLTAITSISTRNPGLASAATPTTDLAGKLG